MGRGNLNQSGLLFVPSLWQRADAIRWLKRVHAWTGFWGALLFLMLGISGVLLNHRNIWKIETGEPTEVSAMNVAVAPGLITDEKALGVWAKRELNLPTEPRAPKKEEGGKKVFLGKAREEAPRWSQQFTHSNGRVTVDYIPGSPSVAVRQEATNGFGLIKNLHKGTGVGLVWVLFMDSIAGALFAMSLTGFLLWSRLHGTRLAAGGIMFACALVATAAIWPFLL
jgi:uncharacterized protein